MMTAKRGAARVLVRVFMGLVACLFLLAPPVAAQDEHVGDKISELLDRVEQVPGASCPAFAKKTPARGRGFELCIAGGNLMCGDCLYRSAMHKGTVNLHSKDSETGLKICKAIVVYS